MRRGRCDQCEAMMINGVFCHEQGCPNQGKDPRTGELWKKECYECGLRFTPKYDGHRTCHRHQYQY